MNEQAYLKTYDPKAFASPIFSVDGLLFTYHQKQLKVLLVERSNHPDKGKWGLPGGFVDLDVDDNLEDTVVRKLREKTGVRPPYIEQLSTIGNRSRDKRGWSVTVCYTALVAHQDCETHVDSVSDARWVELDKLADLKLAFDHREIIEAGREALKLRALDSIVPAYTLPDRFTLSELQHVHEVLLGKPIQKTSFRRRMSRLEEVGLLIDTGKFTAGPRRPAVLYTLSPSAVDHIFVRNLEL